MRAVFPFLAIPLLQLSKVWAGDSLMSLPGRPNSAPTFEWAVLGDSWASGVAYNLSNVYGPNDRQFCYRTKESWGAQMSNDDSWTTGDQSFHFAVCGGSRMADVKKQFEDNSGAAKLVWAMFGGNDAGFGSIARACIYQPVSFDRPSGWGPAWDDDPEGIGECKKNIVNADEFMDDPPRMRSITQHTIDDIFSIARKGAFAKPTFDLYISAYVAFFNAATDDCDKWTFAHDRLSVGRPKLVKGLRQVINDKVEKFNNIQADIIRGYVLPPPADSQYRLHHELPSTLYDGHRFCEAGHTFEDQFYHPDVWLWNLQYYDGPKNEDLRWVSNMDANGIMFMSGPTGFDIAAQTLPPILASDLSQDHDGPAAPAQYGFGWTARPFHPKYQGHTALKEAFIQRMRGDRISGVKPSSPEPATPPAERNECRGLSDRHYVDRNQMKDIIDNQFCPEAARNGPLSMRYHQGTMDEVEVTLNAPAGFKPTAEDCVKYLLGNVIDGCDGNDPNNPENFKGGGRMIVGEATYQVQPQTLRQSPQDGKKGGCDSSYKFLFNEYVIWGEAWATDDWGAGLKGQIDDCALLPNTWDFQYGLGSDGREWTAKFRTGVFQRHCVGEAGKEAGAPSDFGCRGSG